MVFFSIVCLEQLKKYSLRLREKITDKDFLLHNPNTAIKFGILTLIQCYHLLLRLRSDFISIPDNDLYKKGSVQNHRFYVSFSLGEFLHISWPSWPWHFQKYQTSNFVDCTCQPCLMVSLWYIQVLCYWEDYHRSYASFLLHPVRWHVTLICPITEDDVFDHLIKVMSVRLLHCVVTLFL